MEDGTSSNPSVRGHPHPDQNSSKRTKKEFQRKKKAPKANENKGTQ
jgi:hypothetical protein